MASGILGGILGGVAAVGGGIANLINGSAEARRRREQLASERRDLRSLYEWQRRQVGSERADARHAFTRLGDLQRQRMEAAAGRAAVMGGSSGALSAESAASNAAAGDLLARQNAAQEARRDAYDREYRQGLARLSGLERQESMAQSQNMANAFTNASSLAARSMWLLDSAYAPSVFKEDDKEGKA